MGSAKSQSPECGDITAFNLAWWYSYVVEATRAARIFLMSGLSQANCLWARDSSGTGTPDSADHCSKPKARGRSSGTLQRDRMEACSDVVPTSLLLLLLLSYIVVSRNRLGDLSIPYFSLKSSVVECLLLLLLLLE